ncbi:hypothetical protein N9N28_04670, partial [Rubripirellula amarantea]|nr:hypothetical protein [Rubripirellula amarantea]
MTTIPIRSRSHRYLSHIKQENDRTCFAKSASGLRRRAFAELLEPRQMLAGDIAMLQAEVSVQNQASGLTIQTLAEGEQVLEQAERFGAAATDAASSFASGLRDAVAEISRVISAVNSAPALAAEIPYLGSLIPDSIAGATVIDTESIQSLFQLADRFENEVVEPLEDYLDSNPTASAAQLIAQFDFLSPATNLANNQQGVKLNFDPQRQFESSLAALLDPITSAGDSLLSTIPGDALSLDLPFELSLDNFDFDVIQDEADNFSIAIPDLQLNLSRAASIPIDFAANVGFLSGGVMGGSFDLDLGLRIQTSSLLGGTVSLESLQELSLGSLLDDVDFEIIGDGLNVRLPFDFDLAGFETDGLLPTFVLMDSNPLDLVFPEVNLEIPNDADYTAESLLGFHTIDSSSILSSLDQLGSVFGAWQEGDLLNFPLPLSEDLTLGQAFGLAEGFSGGVLQFLKDGNGLPAFNSIQEMIDLIPGVSDSNQGDAFSYDPQSQLLTLSLDFFRAADPIVSQANLSLIAGASDSPIGSIQATPGDSLDDNRLEVTRDLSFGLQLQIDLSNNAKASEVVDVTKDTIELSDLAQNSGENARLWTPVIDLLERLGLAHRAGTEQVLQVQLKDGSVVSANMGIIESHTTLGDWLQRGRVVRDGELVMELELVPYGFAANEVDGSDIVGFDEGNRFVIRDYTSAPTQDFGSVDVEITLFDSGAYGFFDTAIFPPELRSPEIPANQQTVGDVRQWFLERLESYLESTFAASYPGETWRISLQHFKFIGETGNPNPGSAVPELTANADLLAAARPEDHYPVDANVSQTVYPPILAKQLDLIDRTRTLADIEVYLNTDVSLSDYDYSIDGSETVSGDRYFSVLLHEVLHGLGVISGIEAQGNLRFPDRPFAYDWLLQPSGSDESLNDLNDAQRQSLISQGDAIEFSGAYARAANPLSEDRISIHNPAGFDASASLIHVDANAYAGTGETLLPELDASNRQPSSFTPLTLGILQDLGYQLQSPSETTLYQTESQPLFSSLLDTDRDFDGQLRSQPLSYGYSLGDNDVPLSNFVDGSVDTSAPLETLVFRFRDGTQQEINLGSLEGATIGDLHDIAAAVDNLAIEQRRGTLVFRDLSTAVDDNLFSISWKDSGLGLLREIGGLVPIGTASATGSAHELVADQIFRDLPYDEQAPVDRTTTLGRLLSGTAYESLLGQESIASVQLASGDVVTVSSGILNADTTIGEIIGTLFVNDDVDQNQIVLAADIDDRSDRLVLVDQSLTNGDVPLPSVATMSISDVSPNIGIYSILFGDPINGVVGQVDTDQDQRIIGRSLSGLEGQQLEPLERPSIYVDLAQETPTWTNVGDLLRRE